jgi:exopolysaccharide biosynthesis polyprenyl glycosylphosphotransferase
MLKRGEEQLQIFARATDLLLGVGAFYLAFWIRTSPTFFHPDEIGGLDSVSWLLSASIAIHVLLYPYLGFYESLRLQTPLDILSQLIKAYILDFLVLGALVFIFQEKATSRYFLVIFTSLNFGLLVLVKFSFKFIPVIVRGRRYNLKQAIIAGTGNNAARLVEAFRKNRHWRMDTLGLLRESDMGLNVEEIGGIPVIGDLRDLEKIISERAVDEVYFAPDELKTDELAEQVMLCERLGIPARFSMSFFNLPNSKILFSSLDNLPVLTFYRTSMTPLQAFVKRTMDIAVSLLGLALTALLAPWIALKIKGESPGPLIFKQPRVGENGRRFKCYKFRTMFVDAEKRKAELMEKNTMSGPLFKLEKDPRVTSFGAFLRKTSLDELPQFFNILRGDMSLVGTRPPTPDEVEEYEIHYRRRLSIRPGLTGLWQVSGRNKITRFEDVLALDLKYIDDWSVWLDVRILLRTVWVTLFQRGAY